jgi:RNase adapter protein RapZ
MPPQSNQHGAHPQDTRPAGQRLVFVTGPSGAGRSTAVKALEDIGFETIDNLPLSLLGRLLDGPPIGHPLALGIDVRNRDFSVDGLIGAIDGLSASRVLDVQLLYLDCSTDVLIRRFSETRRRHPMAPAESPAQGIARELDLLGPIRARANILIDTSDLTPHDLRAEIERWFDTTTGPRLAVSVQSFSYKRGIPRGVDMVFDCRFLRNPYWDPALRDLDGRTREVSDYVAGDDRFAEFFDKIRDLAVLLLPAFSDEGKSHITLAFGCTGGQHRSVAVAEKLANALAATGWQVSKRHRELEARTGNRAALGRKS